MLPEDDVLPYETPEQQLSRLQEENIVLKKASAIKDATIAELEKLVRIDPLTGIPNRRAGMEELNRQLERILRHGGQGLAVAICDLDNFKPLNDTYGHKQGDEVLRTCSKSPESSILKGYEKNLPQRYYSPTV